MKMTLEQTKLVGLTMELELKTKEYKMLCEELEVLKKQNLDPNDRKYEDLRQKFVKNLAEITKINNSLKELQKK